MVLHYFEAADSDKTEEKTMAVSAGKTVFIAKQGNGLSRSFRLHPPNMFPSVFPPFGLIDVIGRKRRGMACREVVM